jgi:septation ring formation regulator EzrA
LSEYYILKVNDFDKVALDSLDQWFYFLKNSEIPADFDAPGLPEARRKLQKSKLTPAELREYDRHIDELRGKWSMIWSAKLEGRIEAEKESRKVQRQLKKALKEEKEANKAKDLELKQLQAASAAKDAELERLRKLLGSNPPK